MWGWKLAATKNTTQPKLHPIKFCFSILNERIIKSLLFNPKRMLPFFNFGGDMKKMKVSVGSPADLPQAAHQLLNFANDKKVIAFFGEMGSGKTTFIKAICQQLGVISPTSSPTFALVNEYITAKDDLVYHFDFYRIKDEKEAIDVGIEEYFYSGHYCMVEWPEKILNLLPKEIVRVTIEIGNDLRNFTFQYE